MPKASKPLKRFTIATDFRKEVGTPRKSDLSDIKDAQLQEFQLDQLREAVKRWYTPTLPSESEDAADLRYFHNWATQSQYVVVYDGTPTGHKVTTPIIFGVPERRCVGPQ